MTTSTAPAQPVFAVLYTYTEDTVTRDEVRPSHRAFLADLLERGSLLASGPWAPAEGRDDGALLVVTAVDEAAAAALLDEDPFRQAGVVANRELRAWVQVMGPWAPQA
ncbi:YciI family protein [Luteimicrobium sp. NPDC057192]|uniref:YciI family protein n=1 Tax=Luteimicrobium sp. NPDC057192 TaxID=3346042 RepID=UPI003633986E